MVRSASARSENRVFQWLEASRDGYEGDLLFVFCEMGDSRQQEGADPDCFGDPATGWTWATAPAADFADYGTDAAPVTELSVLDALCAAHPDDASLVIEATFASIRHLLAVRDMYLARRRDHDAGVLGNRVDAARRELMAALQELHLEAGVADQTLLGWYFEAGAIDWELADNVQLTKNATVCTCGSIASLHDPKHRTSPSGRGMEVQGRHRLSR